MSNTEKLLKEIDSPINNKLRIVEQDGKKLLNTANTNYSYGTLVEVLEYGLDSIPMTNISSVLLLGMGGGSIIKSLREKYDCHAPVVAVELDPIVIDIAHEEFDIGQEKQVKIHCVDAWDFVAACEAQFDLIIIDIFIDLMVPKKFYDLEFWSLIENITVANGFVVFNAGIDMEEQDVETFVSKLPDGFIYQENYNVLNTNTVIICQKI